MSYAHLVIYNPTIDGVPGRVVFEDAVPVDPAFEHGDAEVHVPEPWASLIDPDSEAWNDYHVEYELLVPYYDITGEQPEGVEVTEVEGGFALKVDGWAAGTYETLALAYAAVEEVREERAYEDECHRVEMEAERAIERYYEERGYWAAVEQEERERAAGAWF